MIDLTYRCQHCQDTQGDLDDNGRWKRCSACAPAGVDDVLLRICSLIEQGGHEFGSLEDDQVIALEFLAQKLLCMVSQRADFIRAGAAPTLRSSNT